MRDVDRVAVGWFLTVNAGARKAVTATEIRCPHGCQLAAVVTVEKSLYLLGFFHPTTTAPPLPVRARSTLWSRKSVTELTLSQFLQLWEQRLIKLADLKAVAPSQRYAVLYAPESTRKVVRCRHEYGLITESVPELLERRKWSLPNVGFERVPPLRDHQI